MRVLSIGSDRTVFEEESVVRERQCAYAEALGALDLIVFSRGERQAINDGALTILPTNSRSRWRYGLDALMLARSLPRPDVVTVQDPFETGLIGWLLARRFRVPLHVQVHTEFLSPEYTKLQFGLLRRAIARFVLARAARVRVVSDQLRDALTSTYQFEAPVRVLPIYVDFEQLRHATPNTEYAEKTAAFERRLLVVARLEPEKDVALALSAFAAAAPEQACLIIVGEGSERVALERRARSLRISERVFFAGRQDAAEFYPLADLVLVTSRFEGYGLVIVEALGCGIPVLSTNVGIAQEAGALVVPKSIFPDALAEWFEEGPFKAVLKAYPYKSFDEYVAAYRDDLAACLVR